MRRNKQARLDEEFANLISDLQTYFKNVSGLTVPRTEIQRQVAIEYRNKIWYKKESLNNTKNSNMNNSVK